MARLVILLASTLLTAMPCVASNAVSLGHSEETTIVEPGTDACAEGTLIYNHDGSFENGYAWQYGGEAEPYYGAFGEGYDLGAGTIACGSFWVSTLPGWGWYVSDCYVWEAGTITSPGAVLGVVTGAVFENVPNWPTVGRNDVDMNISVDGPFTVGCWGDWPGSLCDYFCAADENGPRGHPWTCIAPGQGFPSGWQDPAIVGGYWGPTKSMGCGVYFEQATPVEDKTWGSVKSLFR